MTIDDVRKIELKPCPFCGGKAELSEYGNLFVGISKTVVRCIGCGTKQTHRWIKLKFDIAKVEELTISAWNKRISNNESESEKQ